MTSITKSISSNDFPLPTKSKEYMDSLVPPTEDEFERISSVQEKHEDEHRRLAQQQRRESLLQAQVDQKRIDVSQNYLQDERTAAARLIQKTYRGYRARREIQGFGLDASTRWLAAIQEAQFRLVNQPRPEENRNVDSPLTSRASTARGKWKKASIVARRANHDDSSSDSSSLSSPDNIADGKAHGGKALADRRSDARIMGLRYFLEMVDLKHRYGSSLCTYHEEWKRSSTKENFFYWLDYGEGRDVQLEACPRDRLDRERVRYLSREERQYYLVQIDTMGRLCWAKNGERIDTSGRYKDSIHGVVPLGDPTPPFDDEVQLQPQSPRGSQESSRSRGSLESKREADRAAKYVMPAPENKRSLKDLAHLDATTAVFNKLLRKSVKKNTWIFVADTSFRLYVGIKNSGAFQHSSFLQGSRISAAGLIKIKNGRLTSLSPLSGHYRPPAENFRAFVRKLREQNVDLSHISISKSYAVLVGLEAYMKTRQKGKDVMEKILHGRDKILDPEEVARQEEEAKDKSESAAKERVVLEKEKAERLVRREEEGPRAKVMQKLGVMSLDER